VTDSFDRSTRAHIPLEIRAQLQGTAEGDRSCTSMANHESPRFEKRASQIVVDQERQQVSLEESHQLCDFESYDERFLASFNRIPEVLDATNNNKNMDKTKAFHSCEYTIVQRARFCFQ
jgi:hypothetical protein